MSDMFFFGWFKAVFSQAEAIIPKQNRRRHGCATGGGEWAWHSKRRFWDPLWCQPLNWPYIFPWLSRGVGILRSLSVSGNCWIRTRWERSYKHQDCRLYKNGERSHWDRCSFWKWKATVTTPVRLLSLKNYHKKSFLKKSLKRFVSRLL